MTGEPEETTTTATGTTTTTSTQTSDGTTTMTTGVQPGECEDLGELACLAAPECQPMLGLAFTFLDCKTPPQFLGCMPAETACDAVLLAVCRDGTDEVYQSYNGCIPAGFSACETELARCGACEGLDETDCLAEKEQCRGEYGFPHVEEQGMECVDFKQGVYLACMPSGDPCPPSVPTVCPIGDPDTRFDVTSGCIPFGFEMCEGGTPSCQ